LSARHFGSLSSLFLCQLPPRLALIPPRFTTLLMARSPWTFG
jgi:hypothetical protein